MTHCAGNIIWPFIPFAVQKWGASPEQVGLYAGILASSFFAAQLLCVTAWGRAADIYGRRPCLLAGLIGTGLTMTLFGFARSFGVALLARFLTGALNGNIGTCCGRCDLRTLASNRDCSRSLACVCLCVTVRDGACAFVACSAVQDVHGRGDDG
ncbi:MFS transporter [archaeon]|nr:MAG: MFS transporter [archaeon]